jgi:hypothetical protein
LLFAADIATIAYMRIEIIVIRKEAMISLTGQNIKGSGGIYNGRII